MAVIEKSGVTIRDYRRQCYVFAKQRSVNDVKLFEEFCLLKDFLTQSKKTFFEKLAEKQWCMSFNACNNITQVSELLKICQYFFCILPHNAHVERVFSLMSDDISADKSEEHLVFRIGKSLT